jgi:hypothetical protein
VLILVRPFVKEKPESDEGGMGLGLAALKRPSRKARPRKWHGRIPPFLSATIAEKDEREVFHIRMVNYFFRDRTHQNRLTAFHQKLHSAADTRGTNSNENEARQSSVFGTLYPKGRRLHSTVR